eukprot:TRINITY_DN26922_c0_g1_i1.p1 TRINITY_DN26922_c0_g1~~TRINITY_DN26922_c0_g1_i1.p1  ORF type:complete len:621 (-),score=233.65 TRINITY_DN26922_c0_g1_i1:263-1861(-)
MDTMSFVGETRTYTSTDYSIYIEFVAAGKALTYSEGNVQFTTPVMDADTMVSITATKIQRNDLANSFTNDYAATNTTLFVVNYSETVVGPIAATTTGMTVPTSCENCLPSFVEYNDASNRWDAAASTFQSGTLTGDVGNSFTIMDLTCGDDTQDCDTTCGNGVIDESEECDAGLVGSAGCIDCKIVRGYTCMDTPSVCAIGPDACLVDNLSNCSACVTDFTNLCSECLDAALYPWGASCVDASGIDLYFDPALGADAIDVISAAGQPSVTLGVGAGLGLPMHSTLSAAPLLSDASHVVVESSVLSFFIHAKNAASEVLYSHTLAAPLTFVIDFAGTAYSVEDYTFYVTTAAGSVAAVDSCPEGTSTVEGTVMTVTACTTGQFDLMATVVESTTEESSVVESTDTDITTVVEDDDDDDRTFAWIVGLTGVASLVAVAVVVVTRKDADEEPRAAQLKSVGDHQELTEVETSTVPAATETVATADTLAVEDVDEKPADAEAPKTEAPKEEAKVEDVKVVETEAPKADAKPADNAV